MMFIQFFFYLCIACTPNEPTVESGSYADYYFPLTEMEEGFVYLYTSDSETPDSMYTFRKSEQIDGNWYLISQSLTKEGVQKDYTKEQITENGSFIVEYSIFGRNAAGDPDTANCEIENGEVFRFKQKMNESSLYEISYPHEKFLNIKVKETRTRVLNRKNVALEYMGLTAKTVEFKDKMDITFWEEDKKVDEGAYKYRSYFAKGVGLVKYTIELPDRNVHNTLTNIIPKSEWDKTNE